MEDTKKSYEELDAEQKIALYKAARDLFNDGKSYPEVISGLVEECNEAAAKRIADKGLNEDWDNLFDKARELYANDNSYAEVIDFLSKDESDTHITKYAADFFYRIKNEAVENEIESSTNIFEGMIWALLSLVGLIIIFFTGLSLISKILWSIMLGGYLLQYILGNSLKMERDKNTPVFLEL
jgi:hypothetical protein